MAEQWDPSNGESRAPGGPGLNRNALQATLADLVREADGSAAGAAAPAAPASAPAPVPGAQATGSPRPVVPGSPVPTPSAGPRPLRGPSASRPVVDADPDEIDAPEERVAPPRPAGAVGRISGLAAAAAAAEESHAGPAGGAGAGGAAGAAGAAGASRPAPAVRPKLPFAPEPAPTGSGPAGVIRPGSGIAGGFTSSIAGASLSGGALSGSSLGGRITPGDLGDNLSRLTPTPTEQPTIPLRKRRPGVESSGEADAPGAPGGASEAAKRAQGPSDQAQAQPARPAVVLEAWSPQYDDILPQRPTRTGRAFRRAR